MVEISCKPLKSSIKIIAAILDVLITSRSFTPTYEVNNENDDNEASERTPDDNGYEAVLLVRHSH